MDLPMRPGRRAPVEPGRQRKGSASSLSASNNSKSRSEVTSDSVKPSYSASRLPRGDSSSRAAAGVGSKVQSATDVCGPATGDSLGVGERTKRRVDSSGTSRPPAGSLPLSGLVPFTDRDASLEHPSENVEGISSTSISASAGPSTDDILIEGSLSEIPVPHEQGKRDFATSKWLGPAPLLNSVQNETGEELSPSWNAQYSSRPSFHNGELTTTGDSSQRQTFPHTDLNFISEDPPHNGNEIWYSANTYAEYSLPHDHARLEDLSSDSNFAGSSSTRSQPSSQGRRISRTQEGSLTQSLEGTQLTPSNRGSLVTSLDHTRVSHSQASPETCKSTDLGLIRIGRRGRKSLEALTRSAR